MCFKISRARKAPNNTVVFKVVELRGRKRQSPIYSGGSSPKWRKGTTYTVNVKRDKQPGDTSEAGLYVYLTRKAAQKFINYHYNYCSAVIELKVAKRDWLYTGKLSEGQVATYRKVKVIS